MKRSGIETGTAKKMITTFPVAMRPGDTPVPIPNTMVKTWAADGTMLETAWESRWLPGTFSKEVPQVWRQEGKGCTLKTAHRKLILKRLTTSDSYKRMIL